MSEGEPEISVIVPVYNEVGSVAELHEGLCEVLEENFEIIFVDDGSDDGTRDVLSKLARERSDTRVLGFRRNYGKSYALSAGFRRARGRWIATIDGDLQDDPAEIPRLLERLRSGYDLVGGWRLRRKDSGSKIKSSRLFNWLVRVLCRVEFRDINCGLKVFRREVVDEIRLAGGYHRFLPLLAHWKGFRVGELEVEHHPRRHGRSRYGSARIFRALMDLLVLIFLERFEGRPGRYFAGCGAIMSLAGSGILLGLFVLQRVVGSIQSRYPLLSLGLLLLVVGVQLLSLGFVSELIAYHFRSRHPVEPVVREDGDGAGRSDVRAARSEEACS